MTIPISNTAHFLKLVALILILTAPIVTDGQALGVNRGDNAGSGGRRTIKGQIYLPGGDKEIKSFKVRLENPDAGLMTTVTDADRQFAFNGIAAGNYNLTVDETNEYEGARESVYVEGTSSGPVVMVPIYLRLKPSADPALAGVPKPALDAYIKGMDEVRRQNNKKAIEHLKAAVAAYPSFLRAYNQLGIQYLTAGDLDKAAEALAAALKLKADDFDANLNFGITLLQKKVFGEALSPLRKAIEQQKTAPTPHLYLGIALMNLKQLDEAQQELETTISLPGGNNLAQAHRYLGGIYWGKRDHERAAKELETYLKLAPKAADAERTRTAIKELRSKQ
jgi:Flp pilus assembly protein TadD